MRAKRFLSGALAGVAALTVIAGCAAQQVAALEPKLELRDAARQLAEAQQAGFTLKVTGEVEASVTFGYDKAGAGPEDDRSMIAATIDGVSGTEIRLVDGLLYAKAPVAELAKRFGGTRAEVEQLSEEVAGELPGLDAFFDGKWVSVDLQKATELAASGTLGIDAGPQEQQKALAELATSAANLLDGADVVRDGADSRHLIVTSSTAKAYEEAQRIATAIDENFGDDFGAAPKDQPIKLDLWIDEGKLTAAEIDLAQFDAGDGTVRVEVTTGEPISAPQDATRIAVDRLFSSDEGAGGVLGPDDIGVPATTE